MTMVVQTKKRRIPLPLALASLLILASGVAALVFFLRAPELLVTDTDFDSLYGAGRINMAVLRNSLALFRPIYSVPITGGLADEVAVFAIDAAAKKSLRGKPYCVFFSYRSFVEGRSYAREHPDIPAGVLMGRQEAGGRIEGLITVSTDTAVDMYRAGRAAAILANDGQSAEWGDVIFLYDEYPSKKEQDYFAAGLLAEGLPGVVRYEIRHDGSSPRALVIRGAADQISSFNRQTPALLFSWIDPARVPRNIKVVFDDSPWTQIAAAVRIITNKRQGKEIPSVVRIPGRRLALKGQIKKLKLAFASLPPEAGNGELVE
jgi:hypothetical protein